ncbi:hypothetical protein ACK83U_16850 [Rhizobium sp. WW22]|uniref:hypothetical protein n=1 Tax=Rhizobium sp. WW22 TaxID=3389070 RepID=UPI00399C14F0
MGDIPLVFVEVAAEKARDGMAIAAERVAPASNVCLRENIISIGLSDILVTFRVDADFISCKGPHLLSDSRLVWTKLGSPQAGS